jgi:hypothetical protein
VQAQVTTHDKDKEIGTTSSAEEEKRIIEGRRVPSG